MKMKSLYIIILLVFVSKSKAQELLKLEDAVKIALENNYDIKLSRNKLKIDELNNSIGNAGMLPAVKAHQMTFGLKQGIAPGRIIRL